MHINVVVLYPSPVVLCIGRNEVLIADLRVVFDKISCSIDSPSLVECPPQERHTGSALACRMKGEEMPR